MPESLSSSSPRREPASVKPHATLNEFYRAPEERAGYVNELFNRSAQHYDWISGILSFGTDRHYRKIALRNAGLLPEMRVLDVATGTGLVSQAALDLGIPAHRLTGLDPSRGMLLENKKLRTYPLIEGVGETLPFKDRSFDFISMGYALRHVESLTALFSEFQRVLKPGGRILVLEISRPASERAFKALRFYMQRIVPAIARLRTRKPELPRLMEYYWATIAECVPADTILAALASSGFQSVQRKINHLILSDYQAIKA